MAPQFLAHLELKAQRGLRPAASKGGPDNDLRSVLAPQGSAHPLQAQPCWAQPPLSTPTVREASEPCSQGQVFLK